MLARLEKGFQYIWYQSRFAGFLLLPLAAIFCLLSLVRKQWMVAFRQKRLSRPVIIVGNITVGGTGKTPLVIAIVEYLQSQNLRPGVISRGYGGRAVYPMQLDGSTTAAQSGDEPLLIFHRCGCPVVVSPDRVAAAQFLLENNEVDVIVSDDGLQHYALPRQIEIAVMDGERGVGNGLCLPAGPLRESVRRLQTVDFVVVNGSAAHIPANNGFPMLLQPKPLKPLHRDGCQLPPEKNSTVHAVAAIGNPQRFFTTVGQLGFQVISHPFPDHHHFEAQELLFADNLPVFMTEKDAVKCMSYSSLSNHWYLPVSAILPESFWQALQARLSLCNRG